MTTIGSGHQTPRKRSSLDMETQAAGTGWPRLTLPLRWEIDPRCSLFPVGNERRSAYSESHQTAVQRQSDGGELR